KPFFYLFQLVVAKDPVHEHHHPIAILPVILTKKQEHNQGESPYQKFTMFPTPSLLGYFDNFCSTNLQTGNRQPVKPSVWL
ncbi:hypothetical protein, partial [Aeromonas caviae]|uniref:hypothetical protein n=1 Tax=Aeromonas caviae TaxID=648 RepID=UPI00375511AC